MSTAVEITTRSVPTGLCFSTLQEAWSTLVTLLQASVNINGVIVSKTTPSPDDQDKLWQKLNADGTPERIYVFAAGSWLSRHTAPASGQERRLWVGSTGDLLTYDGGESAVVSISTGPFWEVDTAFAARFPIGPGTLPSTTVIAVTGTGGEEKHTLITDELPSHTHDIIHNQVQVDGGTGETVLNGPNIGTPTVTKTTQATPTAADGNDPHNNMPPYIGAYFIKRTVRQFFRG